MYVNPLRVKRLRRLLWAALAVLVLAAPAQAVLVQYTGTLTSGFGDGGNVSDPGGLDTANNAFPACNPIIKSTVVTSPIPGYAATEGTAMFFGTANVTTGMAPQAVQFPQQSGVNGLFTTCQVVIPNIQPQLTMRTQTTTLIWPGSAGTFQAGGGFAGPTTDPFVFSAPATFQKQFAVASTSRTMGPAGSGPKFGGAIRVNGAINAKLAARTPGGGPNRLIGSIPARLSVGAANGPATPTFFFSTSRVFYLNGMTSIPAAKAVVKQVFFPWTTGKIKASDSTGQFFTFRSRVGFDNRTPNGTNGTLQLVTPAVTLISGIGAPLPFMPTSVLTLVFTPEPAATALLGAGVLTLLGVYAAQRRRR